MKSKLILLGEIGSYFKLNGDDIWVQYFLPPAPVSIKGILLKQKEEAERRKDNDKVLMSLQLGKYKYKKTV
jgi:hypothetical protein